jgi:hypothetical protein
LNVKSSSVGAAGLLATCGLSACAPLDEHIAQDYVVADLGGSNQTLLGARGMVAIDKITAYKLEAPYIYVEVGGYPRFADRAKRSCEYERVDMRGGEVSSPPAKSAEARQFANKIRNRGRKVTQWTCVDYCWVPPIIIGLDR